MTGLGRVRRRLLALAAAALVAAACGSSVPTSGIDASGPLRASSKASGSTAAATPTPTTLVTAFFYAWYGTPAHDGGWHHWNQLDHTPPGDIASSFYPAGGPYSSRDPAVLDRQMAQIKSAGIGAIAVSWWGRGSWDDQTLDAVFAAAGQAGIEVAFHIEPYAGRTPDSIRADIHDLLQRYGASPALLRIARPTAASPSTSPRAVFYIFASNQLPADGLHATLAAIRGTPDDSIVLLHSPRARTATHDGADGVYTYDPLVADPSTLATLVADCVAAKLICSPSVSPGFDNTHAVAAGQSLSRANGARYDSLWQAAIDAHAEWISIVSFNEWHEGTEIEPAMPNSTGGRTYLSFDGAYGLSGDAAKGAYLQRTADWVLKFESSR